MILDSVKTQHMSVVTETAQLKPSHFQGERQTLF